MKHFIASLAVALSIASAAPAMAQTVVIQPGPGWYPGAVLDSIFGPPPCAWDYFSRSWICPAAPPARVVIERKWHKFDPRYERCPSYAVIDQRGEDLYCSVEPYER